MRERKREKGCVRARAEYSQTREFQKALDYADVSQRVSDAGPFDDVCKYRSSMINCSCQDTRYFARAYRNPVSTGETDSAYNFRSSTVGEFSPLSFARSFFPVDAISVPDAKLSRVSPRLSSFPFIVPFPPLLHVIADDEFWWKRRDTCAPFCEQWSKRRRKRFRLFQYWRKKYGRKFFLSLSLKFLLFVTIDIDPNRSNRRPVKVLSDHSKSLFFSYDRFREINNVPLRRFIFDKLYVPNLETSWSTISNGGEAIGRKIYVAFNTAAPFVEAVATSRLHDSVREGERGGGEGVTSISLSYRVNARSRPVARLVHDFVAKSSH